MIIRLVTIATLILTLSACATQDRPPEIYPAYADLAPTIQNYGGITDSRAKKVVVKIVRQHSGKIASEKEFVADIDGTKEQTFILNNWDTINHNIGCGVTPMSYTEGAKLVVRTNGLVGYYSYEQSNLVEVRKDKLVGCIHEFPSVDVIKASGGFNVTDNWSLLREHNNNRGWHIGIYTKAFVETFVDGVD